jgi:hypothetical protein
MARQGSGTPAAGALIAAGAVLIGLLAWIGRSLSAMDQRLARLEGALHAESHAGRPSASGLPSQMRAEPPVLPPVQEPVQFALGYETFRAVWFPTFAAVAEQKCWHAAESAGGRVPGALHYFISLDADGRPREVTADEGTLEGFPMPPKLRACIGDVIRTMRFPPAEPHSARVQVDRQDPRGR